ncbi:Gti1/Pac2 family-domain-containing protein [Abortiporus biennis]|nr:Gti1/Pac2 family-domain-containing protein [Abortiporus biennis]
MQRPTLENVRIRSTRDALQIFYAVARNILPIISRRLDAEERRAIVPGNVYVWEERCANSEATGLGMERWTDGMGWGPSRVRDEFLFYHQRESEAPEDPNNPSAKWASMMKREPRAGVPSYSRAEAERLIKQTYSVHVSLPEDRPHNVTRKWHLTAYFSQTTLDSLNTLDRLPQVGNLVVPQGWFRSARASKTRRADQSQGDELVPTAQDPWGIGPPPAAYGLSQFTLEGPLDSQDRRGYPTPYGMPTVQPGPTSYRGYENTYPSPPEFEQGSSRLSSSPTFPPRLPALADVGLGDYYRDPSPFTQSSSTPSDHSSSPRAYPTPTSASSRSSAPIPPSSRSGESPIQLVPLSFLQSLPPPSRNPTDEAFLRRISAPKTTSSRFANF